MKKTILVLTIVLFATAGCTSILKSRGKGEGSGLSFTVAGTLSKVAGTVVLQNNGGDDLTLSSDGTFSFSEALAKGEEYDVKVKTQPVGRTCIVSNGSGRIESSDISNVDVKCGAFYGIPNETQLGQANSWEEMQ